LTGAAIRLRPATAADCALTFGWANDPEVRAASFFSRPITEDEHRIWYAESLAGARVLYIAELRAVPIGLARLDPLPDNRAEVGLTIAAPYRGRGLAVRVLDTLCRTAVDRGCADLVARVRTDNPRSRRAFERAGFRWQCDAAVNGVEAWQLERELD
jgi:UDP-2,4-diacetamido-2,4,6-trideoxy-beta-L-altropyranose hydrolase